MLTYDEIMIVYGMICRGYWLEVEEIDEDTVWDDIAFGAEIKLGSALDWVTVKIEG